MAAAMKQQIAAIAAVALIVFAFASDAHAGRWNGAVPVRPRMRRFYSIAASLLWFRRKSGSGRFKI
jgi:hypothetical protein